MAENNNDANAASRDDDTTIPRVKLSEIGYPGLKIFAYRVIEERAQKLRYPEFYDVVDEMMKDDIIATGLRFFNMMVGRAKWVVKTDADASETTKQRAKYLRQMMNDMEHSWDSFIHEVMTYVPYGFAVMEKVYRKRLKRNGSKYNDGLVGWKAFPPRNQYTITYWIFSDDRRDLLKIRQSTLNLANQYNATPFNGVSYVEIPREKFMLFSADTRLNNPLGNSPLKAVYLTWQYRKMIVEQEQIGVARDLGGIPKFRVPSRIMSSSASEAEKEQYEAIKRMARNLHVNQQAGIVLPSDADETGRQPYYDFELVSSSGGKNYDTNQIIQRLNNQILTALFADVLTMGQTSSGSFNLADSKLSLVEIALRHRLNEIKDVLNHDLIKQTFELNGWDISELPYFDYEMPDNTSLEEFSKAVQRIAATSSIEKDREFFNVVRQKLGMSPLAEDEPVHWDEVVVDMASRSGDGMVEGLNSGTGGKTGSEGNSSDMNSDNTA